jgi:hypothetical protein
MRHSCCDCTVVPNGATPRTRGSLMAVPNPTQDRHGVSINTEPACRFLLRFTKSANRTVINSTVDLSSQLGRGRLQAGAPAQTPTPAGASAPSFLPQCIRACAERTLPLPQEGQDFPSFAPLIIDKL